MEGNISINKSDFKFKTCPESIDQRILGFAHRKKKSLRFKTILVPSLLMLGIAIFSIAYFGGTNQSEKLTAQDKEYIQTVLDLFEESVAEVTSNM